MENYLKLLRESLELFIRMHKICGPSVADYILQIETAVNFIYKALKTEDRLDIFRALEKSYDVLKSKSGRHSEGNLEERIKSALDGLQEQKFIKKSELKKLTKIILREIYGESPGENPDIPPELLKKIQKDLEKLTGSKGKLKLVKMGGNKKYIDDKKSAIELFNKIFGCIISNAKHVISSPPKTSKLDISVDSLQQDIHVISLLFHEWYVKFNKEPMKNIYTTTPSYRQSLPMNKPHEIFDGASGLEREFLNILTQLENILFRAYVNVYDYKNYINSKKDLEYFNVLYKKARKLVDDLFKMDKTHEK